jgi:hypothetical protein
VINEQKFLVVTGVNILKREILKYFALTWGHMRDRFMIMIYDLWCLTRFFSCMHRIAFNEYFPTVAFVSSCAILELLRFAKPDCHSLASQSWFHLLTWIRWRQSLPLPALASFPLVSWGALQCG